MLSALKADPELADIPVIMLTIVDDKRIWAIRWWRPTTSPSRSTASRLVRDSCEKYRRTQPAGPMPGGRGRRRRRREMVVQLLESRTAGRSIEAENGRVGLERLAERPPDLILLDLMMPEMDGFEFLRCCDRLRRARRSRWSS